MKIDLSCPIEILRTEVLSDDRGRCRAYIDIINVSERPIRRIDAHARWLGESGMSLADIDLVFEGMSMIANGRAQLTVAGEIPAAAGIALEPSSIEFADFGAGWSAEDAVWTEYEFVPEPPGARLDRLRNIAGRDAVCYPSVQGENWLCVCGRLNPGTSPYCVKCHRGRERIFAALSEEAGEPGYNFPDRMERRERFEERRRELRIQSERARRKRRERRVRALIISVLVVLTVATLLMLGVLLGYIAY